MNTEMLIYTMSRTKAGKAFMEWLEEECISRVSSDEVKMRMQAGKQNLYLDVLDMIERGDTATHDKG